MTPWICLWPLSSEELKGLSLPISSLSRLPREVGLIISISQMSVCHDSLRGSDTRLLAPPGLGGAHAPLSSLSSGPVAPRFLDDRDGLAYCEGCSELQDHGS